MDNLQELAEALDRIARTPDGLILYNYLQSQLCAICQDRYEPALRSFEGRRIFARELMAPMAEGIEASGGRNNIVIGRRDADGGGRKRRQSIREYLAGQPSWRDEPDDQRPSDVGEPA